jgi:hypothetical protein
MMPLAHPIVRVPPEDRLPEPKKGPRRCARQPVFEPPR